MFCAVCVNEETGSKRSNFYKNTLQLNEIPVQQRMIKAQAKEISKLTRKFTMLMLLGKLFQASNLINRANGGVLCVNEEVKNPTFTKTPCS